MNIDRGGERRYATTSKYISERSGKEPQERWRSKKRLGRRGKRVYKRQLLFSCVWRKKKCWLPSRWHNVIMLLSVILWWSCGILNVMTSESSRFHRVQNVLFATPAKGENLAAKISAIKLYFLHYFIIKICISSYNQCN